MKRALICVFVLACGPSWGFADETSNLTVVLDFNGPHAARSVTEMQKEAQQVIKDAGVHLAWSNLDEANQHTYPDLVVMRFKGECILKPDPLLYGELGPPSGALAFTYDTNGAVQPFGEVACDKVAASVRSAMWGSDYAIADVLLGRALGRVLVHELVHMLTKSQEHGRDGVEQRALSGKQLIANSLPLSRADLQRLKQTMAHR
jgi:hypothetical protein